MSHYFYKDMVRIYKISDITNESAFKSLPEDWIVIITDIVGSTRAIEDGHYKNVNIVGAASITCAINAASPYDIPYVFGGDGATIAIPPDCKGPVLRALSGQIALSKHNFSLDLRVGYISVRDLIKNGKLLEVARYEVAPGNDIAFFRGGGLSYLEKLLKSNFSPPLLKIEENSEVIPNNHGLSCRWEPLSNNRGLILTLLVSARRDDRRVYNLLIKEIESIFNDIRDVNPVQNNNLKMKISRQLFNIENSIQNVGFSPVKKISTWLTTLIGCFFVKFRLKFAGFDPDRYYSEMTRHVDFHKFDDMFRMVVDCSAIQKNKLESFLEKLRKEGDIYYGLHVSDQALMTCLVFSSAQSKHIHFIDGSNGGYALAASYMKKQQSDI